MDYVKMNKDEVFARVELYKKAGVEGVPEFDTKKAAVVWLEEQEKTLGTPHIVTQEDIDNNKDAALELTLDEVVILPPVSEAGATDPRTPEEIAAANAANEGVKPTDTTAVAPKAVPTSSEGATISAKPPVNLFFNGRPVISAENKLLNGKIYKEVITADATQLLTEEEFNNYVKAH